MFHPIFKKPHRAFVVGLMSDGARSDECEVLFWPMSAYFRASGFGYGRLILAGRLGQAAHDGGLGSSQIRLLVDLVHGNDFLGLIDDEMGNLEAAERGRRGAARLRVLLQSVEDIEFSEQLNAVPASDHAASANVRADDGVAPADTVAAGSTASSSRSAVPQFVQRGPPAAPITSSADRMARPGICREQRREQRRSPYDAASISARQYFEEDDGDDPPRCLSCGTNYASAVLGGIECWECHGEH